MSAFRSWGTTDRGPVRPTNEDAFVDRCDLGLWAVADGLGGHEAGEFASGLIAQELENIPPGLEGEEMAATVRRRLHATHKELLAGAAALGPHATIASTVVAALARGDRYTILWAGDSRAYLLRGGKLRQVTKDHSLVQEMVDSGKLSVTLAERHPRANVITRAVGIASRTLDLDAVYGQLDDGDRLLLCSDGLNKAIDDSRIAALTSSPSPAQALVEEALRAGARDNVTAVVIEALGRDAN